MKISTGMELAWQLGGGETVAAKKPEIGPIQFFCGIAKLADLLRTTPRALGPLSPADIDALLQEVNAALEPLENAGVDLTTLRRRLRAQAGIGSHVHGHGAVVHRSEPLRDLFRHAQLVVDERRVNRQRTKDSHDVVGLRDLVIAMLNNRSHVLTRVLEEQGVDPEALYVADIQKPAADSRRATPLLDRIGRDLTALAAAGELSPVIGRRDELLRLLQTLARRSKNNPVLVGEPGVGKTAVVELLAQRLVEGKNANTLGANRIIEISMSALLAGAKHLGEREERFETLVAECRGNDDVLLFIDELHTLVAAGGQSGTVDPKDILKPALARGEIRCIGATTTAEYDKYIEKDAALERRFDRILVVEPTPAETLDILDGVAPHLATHHGIEFDTAALQSAVELSARFDTDHQLPDKAIDLLDKAAANVRIPALSVAAIPGLSQPPATVSSDAIVDALAHKLGLPRHVLAAQGSPRTGSDVEAFLNQRILGQTAAAKAVAERLRLADAGLSKREGPRAVMLFLGSTGVGKTEMARALAERLFGDERSLIRLDMSEFMDEHDVVKLIGAPPGYIGHDEPGQLTGRLRAKPHAVVLLDEIDKAHPRALDLLLQVFDAGRITDSKGRTIDVRHAVFLMTSNVPASAPGGRIGFLPSDSETTEERLEIVALKNHCRPEFLNRIDATIVFDALAHDALRELTLRHIERIRERLDARFGKMLTVDNEVVEHLCEHGSSKEYGARELRRTIERQLQAPLSDLMLSGDCDDWPGVSVAVTDGRLRFDPAKIPE